MTKVKKLLILVLLMMMVGFVTSCTPAPMSITIVVIDPPMDLTIHAIHADESGDTSRASVSHRLWETYFRLSALCCCHTPEWWSPEGVSIRVSSRRYGEFEMTIPVERRQSPIIRLDLENETFVHPYSHGRNAIIMLCWLIILSVVDSFTFFLFGYRKKQSWKRFLRVNLPMQVIFISVWTIYHLRFVIININMVLWLFIVPLSFLFILGTRVMKLIVELLTMYDSKKFEEHSNKRAVACAVVMSIIGIILVIILGNNLPLPRL